MSNKTIETINHRYDTLLYLFKVISVILYSVGLTSLMVLTILALTIHSR